MSLTEADISGAIGRRIKLERVARGWSLADIAGRSGVSKAAIGKVERGETSPTAVVLVKIAGAFDLTLAGLLVRAEGGQRLARAADQPVWQDPDTGYRRRQVLARPDHPLEIVDVRLPAGREVVMPASSYARIRQAVWVMDGRLVIDEGGERHELAAGDCLAFGPPCDVTFANETAATCTYVVVLARS
ncbi:helix-turn-helix domain-containing protein [Marinivivus vitaminiproducens]|uniref:helix-turn-helix domain-containing protein n=1 Tax=Marinivivus vitaminiproducens TaxID=3035935 RepID=UPI0027A6D3DE|nr:XRE family transcriptional regulator [Geminicoccaceae bacterium SCSIO 64248]